jgi:hypothetical protein
MRRIALTYLLAIVSSVFVSRDSVASDEAFAWELWRNVPVLDGGRAKPLDSLAWETFRAISNCSSMNDPDSGKKFDANTLYLVMWLEWQGTPGDVSAAADASSQTTGYFAARPTSGTRRRCCASTTSNCARP